MNWAGDTTRVIDTDTGEAISAYVFVAKLLYSGYGYLEAFLFMNQECGHHHFQDGVEKYGRNEITLNTVYWKLTERVL